MKSHTEKRYASFEAFWPFYLSQHRNAVCRNLHLFGTSLGLIFAITAIATTNAMWLLGAPVVGYFFSWIGHFVFEKNRPATFTYPVWSFRGDFRMLKLFYTGKLNAELLAQKNWVSPL